MLPSRSSSLSCSAHWPDGLAPPAPHVPAGRSTNPPCGKAGWNVAVRSMVGCWRCLPSAAAISARGLKLPPVTGSPRGAWPTTSSPRPTRLARACWAQQRQTSRPHACSIRRIGRSKRSWIVSRPRWQRCYTHFTLRRGGLQSYLGQAATPPESALLDRCPSRRFLMIASKMNAALVGTLTRRRRLSVPARCLRPARCWTPASRCSPRAATGRNDTDGIDDGLQHAFAAVGLEDLKPPAC